MSLVPEEIVAATVADMEEMDDAALIAAINALADRQPHLAEFVVAQTEEYGDRVQEMGVNLLCSLCAMFERMPGHRVELASAGQVERIANRRRQVLDSFIAATGEALEQGAQRQYETQPHVFVFLAEALDHPELEAEGFSAEDSGLLFEVCAVAVEVLTEVCRPAN